LQTANPNVVTRSRFRRRGAMLQLMLVADVALPRLRETRSTTVESASVSVLIYL